MWRNKNKAITTKAYVDDFLILENSKNYDNIECFCACKITLRLSRSFHTDSVEELFQRYPNLINAFEHYINITTNNNSLRKYIKNIKLQNYKYACNYAATALHEIKTLNSTYGRKNYNSSSYIEHDYFKIVSSSAFRRLQDKTQLFLMENEDFARRRLTHSLEVSSIAEKIACNSEINKLIGKKGYSNYYDLSDVIAIAKCSGLLHDIGNPPFGHSGESSISSFFKKREIISELEKHGLKVDTIYYNDLIKFDGNAQSLRIASKLLSFDNKPGASLTASTLGSIIKYPFDSMGSNKNKLGYFQSEKSLVELLKTLGVYEPNYRNPFAVILECADDLAYLISDLEDGIHKKEITYADFEKKFKYSRDPKSRDFWKSVKDNLESYKNDYINYFEKSIRPVLFQYRENFITSINNINNKKYSHNNIIQHIVFDGVDSNFSIINESEYKKLFEAFGDIKKTLFTRSKLIIVNELQGETIIQFLLSKFFDAIIDSKVDTKAKTINNNNINSNKILSLLSRNLVDAFFEEIRSIDKKKKELLTYYKMRLIVDHISGMTDNYARNLYLTLNSIRTKPK